LRRTIPPKPSTPVPSKSKLLGSGAFWVTETLSKAIKAGSSRKAKVRVSLPVPVTEYVYCDQVEPVAGLVRLSSGVPSQEALKSLGFRQLKQTRS